LGGSGDDLGMIWACSGGFPGLFYSGLAGPDWGVSRVRWRRPGYLERGGGALLPRGNGFSVLRIFVTSQARVLIAASSDYQGVSLEATIIWPGLLQKSVKRKIRYHVAAGRRRLAPDSQGAAISLETPPSPGRPGRNKTSPGTPQNTPRSSPDHPQNPPKSTHRSPQNRFFENLYKCLFLS
jgi:hypothetical protein